MFIGRGEIELEVALALLPPELLGHHPDDVQPEGRHRAAQHDEADVLRRRLQRAVDEDEGRRREEGQEDLEEDPALLAEQPGHPRVGTAANGPQVGREDLARRVQFAASCGLAVGRKTKAELIRRPPPLRRSPGSWLVSRGSGVLSGAGGSLARPARCRWPPRRSRARRARRTRPRARARTSAGRGCASPIPARAPTTPPSAASSSRARLTSTVCRSRAVVLGRGGGRAHDPGQALEGRRPAVEPIELEAEDRLALDALLELVGRAEGEDPAVVDDRDPVAQLVGLGHVVGRQEDRPARDRGLPGEDQLADGAGRGHVEAEGRLVEEEDPRVVEEAPGEVHLLALAGRQRADALLASARRARRPRSSSSTRAQPRLRRQAVELAEHPELLADGQDPVAGLLAAGDHVHDPADLLGLALDVEAEDVGGAGRRQQQRRQDLDERRLAGAVGSEQAEELAGLDLEIDPLEGDDRRRLDVVDAADAADVDGERLRTGTGTWRTQNSPRGAA